MILADRALMIQSCALVSLRMSKTGSSHEGNDDGKELHDFEAEKYFFCDWVCMRDV